MNIERAKVSCGAVQLYNLADVTEARLNAMLRSTYKWHRERTDAEKGTPNGGITPGCIFAGETVLFSDSTAAGNGGAKLVKIINEHDLGPIQSLKTINPNTRREIRTRIWVYNGKKIPTPRP